MSEEILFDNGFFEFVKSTDTFLIDGKERIIHRNMVRRPPGIRAIIVDDKSNKILLSREFRYELNDWDYRLPGGKVFDSLHDYKLSIQRDDVLDYVEKAVFKESLEEVGIRISHPKLYKVSHDGAGCIWDLYYYEIVDYEVSSLGPSLEEDEVIDGFVWKSYDEVIRMCLEHQIQEDRTVGVLLSYILSKKK